MDNLDGIKRLSLRIEKQKASALTEEATKTAFILPFLQELGYDIFDPHIVIPEFTADIGIKKGEKVDYAIKINDKIAILIECKACNVSLGQAQVSQLSRYFHVTEARFSILTNGIEYWFYTDIDEPNKMDTRPFFLFNILDHRPDDLIELQKFTHKSFDINTILSTASNLKYLSALKAEILREFDGPSDEMVRLLVGRIFDGNITQKIRNDFLPIVASAFKDAVRDRVSDRLVTALEVTSTINQNGSLNSTPNLSNVQNLKTPDEQEKEETITTQDEIEAFHIVKAIARSVVKPDRIFMRDGKSYCAILLDDNNRKPLSRLYFNAKSVKYISLFDQQKNEERIKIESIDDIYSYADRISKTAKMYTNEGE